MRTAVETGLSLLVGACRRYPPFVVYGGTVFRELGIAGSTPPAVTRHAAGVRLDAPRSVDGPRGERAA